MMEETRFDMKELGVDHSPYVDFLLKEFQTMRQKLGRELKSGCIPPKVKNYVWEATISYAMEQLVEGFSRAKKVTTVLS
jgi:hypothetical protein